MGGENLTFQIGFLGVWVKLGAGQGFVWATSFLRVVKFYATNINLEMSISRFTKFCIFYEGWAVTIGYNWLQLIFGGLG